MRLRFSPLALCAFVLALSACAGKQTKPGEPEEPSTYEGVSITEPSVEQEKIENYGPTAPAEEEKAQASTPRGTKLCLILGPGMARALAHAAVLEAINKSDIPVHCVVGSEMGAVVAALYAHSRGSTNNLQWQLFKFNNDNYFDFPLISLRESKAAGKKLNSFLRGIFRDQMIESLPIKFGATATEPNSGSVRFLDKGGLVDSLSASLALPGIFQPWRVRNEGELVSGAVSSPAPIDLAKKLGGNFLVLVDVVGDGSQPEGSERFQKAFAPARNLLRLQRKEVDFVIDVKANELPFDDFSRQGEILDAGTQAAEANVGALKAAWEKAVAEHGAP